MRSAAAAPRPGAPGSLGAPRARRVPQGTPSGPSHGPLGAQALVRAEAALVAVFAVLPVGGRPPQFARVAIADAYADIWACRRLNRAAEQDRGAAAVVPYLVPRLLLEGADGLAAALGRRSQDTGGPPAVHRRHVRALEALAAVPDVPARIHAVTARLRHLADGDDRLARPLVCVPLRALADPLRSLVTVLEEERESLVGWARGQADDAARSAFGVWDPRRHESAAVPGPWAMADRYALLTAVASCLDGWRVPGGERRGPAADRGCLVAALDRLTAGLAGQRAASDVDWHDEVYAAAAHMLSPVNVPAQASSASGGR